MSSAPVGTSSPLICLRACAIRRASGTHERAPDGFLMAYGIAIAPGHKPRASVLDLTPTILYYLGLPVGRDMDGVAQPDIFRDSFTASRPITFIPTYNR